MKKKYLLLLLLMMFFFIGTGKVSAYFRIDNYKMDCSLNEQGDMSVAETITYGTDEYRNGIYRDILIKNPDNLINSADDLSLSGVYVDDIPYNLTFSANNGDSGVYVVTDSDNNYDIKVYTPFNHTGKTIKYIYTLSNVAVKYNDIAELFWNFVGTKWQDEIKNLTVTVTLPEASKDNKIYVFGHGSDNGKFAKKDNFITLTASDIKPGQAIDARILFDNNAISLSNKTVNKDVLNKYINMEEKMYRYKNGIWGLLLDPKNMAYLFSILAIIVGIIIYIMYDKEIKGTKYQYYRDMPGNFEPDMIQYIFAGKASSKTLWISFLNLIRKGVFKIEKIENQIGIKTYKINYINANYNNYKEHERAFIEWINFYFDDDDSGNKSVDLLTLKARIKNDTDNYQLYKSFSSDIKSEVEGIFGIASGVPTKVAAIPIILMIILFGIIILMTIINKQGDFTFFMIIFLGMTTVIYTVIINAAPLTIGTFLFLLIHFSAFQFANIMILKQCGIDIMYIPYILTFILIQYVYKVKKYSPEQRDIINQIKGLKSFIKDFSTLDKSELEQIKLWDQFFVVAVALNLDKKILNKFYKYVEQYKNNEFSNDLLLFGSAFVFDSSFADTFSDIRTSSISSSGSGFSGSSGGFSGGGGSGGGGGGGGGGGSF